MQEQVIKTLKIIKDHFGKSIFRDSAKFKAVLLDTPIESNGDIIRNLLRIAICEIQAYSRLEKALAENDKFVVENLSIEMSSKYLMDKSATTMIMGCIAEVLGHVIKPEIKEKVHDPQRDTYTPADTVDSDIQKKIEDEKEFEIRDLTEAIRLDPYNYLLYKCRGVEYQYLGQLDNAIKDFTKAININDSIPGFYVMRAEVYKMKGLFDDAIEDYNEAIYLDSKFEYAYAARGFAFWDIGNYDAALDDFTQCIKIDKDFVSAYLYRAEIYIDEKEQYKLAIKDCTKAISLDPDNYDAYYLRGAAYFNYGQYDDAIKDFTKSIKLNPSDGEAYHYRACAYQNINKYDKAKKDYEQAVKLYTKGDNLYEECKEALQSLKYH